MIKQKKYWVITTDSRALAMLPPNFSEKLVHHSDRGGQCCSSLYTGILKEHGIQVSGTRDGSPYDNGIAERVNEILKREWLNDMVLKDIDQAHRNKKELFARVMY